MHCFPRPFAGIEQSDILLLLCQDWHAEVGSYSVGKKAFVIGFESSPEREGKATGVNPKGYLRVGYVLCAEYLRLFGELQIPVQRSRRDPSCRRHAPSHGFHGEYVRE